MEAGVRITRVDGEEGVTGMGAGIKEGPQKVWPAVTGLARTGGVAKVLRHVPACAARAPVDRRPLRRSLCCVNDGLLSSFLYLRHSLNCGGGPRLSRCLAPTPASPIAVCTLHVVLTTFFSFWTATCFGALNQIHINFPRLELSLYLTDHLIAHLSNFLDPLFYLYTCLTVLTYGSAAVYS